MKTILILSTDREVSEHLRNKLSAVNFNVKSVSDPNSIARSIEKHNPDLLLIDFILQDGNGGSICHQIKCNSETRNLPVILLTDHISSFPFFKKFGCDDFIEKPFSRQLLLSRINRCLTAKPRITISNTNAGRLDAGKRAASAH